MSSEPANGPRDPEDVLVELVEGLCRRHPGRVLGALAFDAGPSAATAEAEKGVPAGYLSMDATCTYLGGISRSTLRTLLARGDLPSVRLGRLRLISREALREFARSLPAVGKEGS
jgi:excisionase family DNA binding protein